MTEPVLVVFVAESVNNHDFSSLIASAELKRFGGRLIIRRAPSGLSPGEISQGEEADWVAFVSVPLVFTKAGLRGIIAALTEAGASEALYFDSLTNDGTVVLRPIFSPERLRGQFYVGDFVAYRPSAVRQLTSVRSGWDSATPYELILAAAEHKIVVSRSPLRLYRVSDPEIPTLRGSDSWLARRDVLERHLRRTGGGSVTWDAPSGSFITERPVIGAPLVSIVIPTRGVRVPELGRHDCVVVGALRSIIAKTGYSNFEIILVVDEIAEDDVLVELAQIAGPRLRIIRWNRPFNFSQKMNFGVLHSRGEYLLLLNDDVQVLSTTWLESLLALAQLPNAGMVGAMLYYEDETIQHAGHAYHWGSPTHIGLGLPRGSKGPQNAYLIDREVSGVTAACAMMSRSVFDEVGGFTALLPGNFNDVDLCLKVGWKNFDIYWTPRAELYHFESKTRDAHVHYYELDLIGRRWGLRLHDSRYWPALPWAEK
jgi:GT2 family glycosyltransferase